MKKSIEFPAHSLPTWAKPLLVISVLALVLFASGMSGTSVRAQAPATPTRNSAYFTSHAITLSNGTGIDEYIIHGPPQPPPGTELQRTAVRLPERNQALDIKTLIVPAFSWFFGCSATSGAMIAGYYDRNGFANMYTGPTNGGVMPLDNSSWPTWTDGYGAMYRQSPLTASHNGLDGRTTRGSIDDYWVKYMGGFLDPYITNGWTQHTRGDALGDYMKTSQSAYGNDDGSTSFWNYTSSATPLTCSAMQGYGITNDGTDGRRLFYQAKGYTVTNCYNQKTDNTISGGFSFAQYKAEIDAGRPVMLNLAGHTIVGVGYNDSTNTVYLHDTWDYNTHAMTWGGSYAGMQLLSVSIVNIQAALPNTPTRTATPTLTSTPTRTATPTYIPRTRQPPPPTPTRTPTATRTPTPSPTRTPTVTGTPTRGERWNPSPPSSPRPTVRRPSIGILLAPVKTETSTPTATPTPTWIPATPLTATLTATPNTSSRLSYVDGRLVEREFDFTVTGSSQ